MKRNILPLLSIILIAFVFLVGGVNATKAEDQNNFIIWDLSEQQAINTAPEIFASETVTAAANDEANQAAIYPIGINKTIFTPANTPVNVTLEAMDENNNIVTECGDYCYGLFFRPDTNWTKVAMNGTVSTGSATVTYTPDAGFEGTDYFIFRATFDGRIDGRADEVWGTEGIIKVIVGSVQNQTNQTNATNQTVKIEIMKHLCDPSITRESDFTAIENQATDNIGKLIKTVLACPTIVNPGDIQSPGAVAGGQFDYNFSVTDGITTKTLDDATYHQQKLCEDMVNRDVNNDGNISNSTCLDVSHHELSGFSGMVTITETSPPTGRVFGTIRFSPSELMANNDKESLISFGNSMIKLNTAKDNNNEIMIHVYNFVPSAQNATNQSCSQFGQTGFSALENQTKIREDMRMLWNEHVVKTRQFNIESLSNDSNMSSNLSTIRQTLLQNEVDMGNAMKPFLGETGGNQLIQLLTDHMTDHMMAVDMINATKNNDTTSVEVNQTKSKENADDIATFLSSANPMWTKEELNRMLLEHMNLTMQEVVFQLNNDTAADTANFEAIKNNSRGMADMLSDGIIELGIMCFNQQPAREFMIDSSNGLQTNISASENDVLIIVGMNNMSTNESNFTQVTLSGPIRIISITNVGNIFVLVPGGTKITGVQDWNGRISLPKKMDSPSMAIAANPGKVVDSSTVIRIADSPLTFDKAIRIFVPGQAGKNVAYISNGTFSRMDNNCAEDNQTAADNMTETECKFVSGNDMVIWTKHFTEFVFYSEADQQSNNDNGGGGSGNTRTTRTATNNNLNNTISVNNNTSGNNTIIFGSDNGTFETQSYRNDSGNESGNNSRSFWKAPAGIIVILLVIAIIAAIAYALSSKR